MSSDSSPFAADSASEPHSSRQRSPAARASRLAASTVDESAPLTVEQGPAYVSGSWAGSPGASQVIERYIFATPVTFPAGLAGSYGASGTAATAIASFAIQKNGAAVGTMAFAAGSATASFTMAAATTYAAGDVLTIVAPATPDPTLANLAWTLSGSL